MKNSINIPFKDAKGFYKGDAREIPVPDISVLINSPTKYVCVSNGGGIIALEIIRRNPPSKRHPEGSVTAVNYHAGPILIKDPRNSEEVDENADRLYRFYQT
jgi:hypothetical protein